MVPLPIMAFSTVVQIFFKRNIRDTMSQALPHRISLNENIIKNLPARQVGAASIKCFHIGNTDQFEVPYKVLYNTKPSRW